MAIFDSKITVSERKCLNFEHFRSQTVMGAAPLEGRAFACRKAVTGGVGVTMGAIVAMAMRQRTPLSR
jgi:hypothetical protein